MSDQKPRIYVGNGKKPNAEFDLTNFSICIDDCKDYLTKSEKNGKTYLNLTMGANKQVSSFGTTHSIWINDYKPNKQEQPKPASVSAGDGLPF